MLYGYKESYMNTEEEQAKVTIVLLGFTLVIFVVLLIACINI